MPDLLDPLLLGDRRLQLSYRLVAEEQPEAAAHALRCSEVCCTGTVNSEPCDGGSHYDCDGCLCTCHPKHVRARWVA